MAEYICKNGVLRPINHIYQCVDRLVEGIDYEFVNGLLVHNYNFITITPNYPISFKIKSVKGFQNIVICGNKGWFFLQNYSSSYKYFQFWNGSSAQQLSSIPTTPTNFLLEENSYSINNTKRSYSKWDVTQQLRFNTTRSDTSDGQIVFYNIKSATMDLRPIRLLRDVSGKHTSNKQPKSAESLGLLDVNSQILYFGSGSSIEVYND